MSDFTGKNVLVVGGSSGIGLELTKRLTAGGANVYVASRRQPEGVSAQHVPFDATDFDEKAFDSLPDSLHGLAYLPGSINLKPFKRLRENDFLNDFQLNVMGAIKVVQANLERLRKAEGAGVVFYSTVAVSTGMNFHASVATAKGALEGLARSLAAELASANIRVNVVAPSLTDTPMAEKLLNNDAKRKASAERHPIKRVGTPGDMAGVSAFLLSDAAGWVTGQTIHVDGGMSSLRPL